MGHPPFSTRETVASIYIISLSPHPIGDDSYDISNKEMYRVYSKMVAYCSTVSHAIPRM